MGPPFAFFVIENEFFRFLVCIPNLYILPNFLSFSISFVFSILLSARAFFLNFDSGRILNRFERAHLNTPELRRRLVNRLNNDVFDSFPVFVTSTLTFGTMDVYYTDVYAICKHTR